MVADGVRQVVESAKKVPALPSSSRTAPSADEIVAAISNDPAVLSAYEHEVKAGLSQRLKDDPDYDEQKHPNTSKFK